MLNPKMTKHTLNITNETVNFNPLSVNPTTWSNKINFVGLALEGLTSCKTNKLSILSNKIFCSVNFIFGFAQKQMIRIWSKICCKIDVFLIKWIPE